MYIQTTRLVKILVTPTFLGDQSSPDEHHYVWAYTIQLENMGPETVQLISRYWHITDANGALQEVRGDGVVGEQPVLESGDVYQYTSGVSLTTPSGIMKGTYKMINQEGESFDVIIPAFSLDSPEQLKRPN